MPSWIGCGEDLLSGKPFIPRGQGVREASDRMWHCTRCVRAFYCFSTIVLVCVYLSRYIYIHVGVCRPIPVLAILVHAQSSNRFLSYYGLVARSNRVCVNFSRSVGNTSILLSIPPGQWQHQVRVICKFILRTYTWRRNWCGGKPSDKRDVPTVSSEYSWGWCKAPITSNKKSSTVKNTSHANGWRCIPLFLIDWLIDFSDCQGQSCGWRKPRSTGSIRHMIDGPPRIQSKFKYWSLLVSKDYTINRQIKSY